MSKFIEVTDPNGKNILVNTEHIVSVSDVHEYWSVEYAAENNFRYVPSTCLVVIGEDYTFDEWFILEEYKEIATKLLN